MLVLTASHGSVVKIDTPAGPIELYFRQDLKCRSRVRVGIDAPKAWKITRRPKGWDPDLFDKDRGDAR